MELKYFLEDETVSVQQVGAEKLLLKRQLLPKKFSWADQDLRPLAPSSSETIEMLTLDDIEVGGAIDVLGRPMRVYDCDPPSRALGECSNGWLWAAVTVLTAVDGCCEQPRSCSTVSSRRRSARRMRHGWPRGVTQRCRSR